VEALIEGLADGTIEIIASDHAPHCAREKEVEFDRAPFGHSGLETELALALMLVHRQVPHVAAARREVSPSARRGCSACQRHPLGRLGRRL